MKVMDDLTYRHTALHAVGARLTRREAAEARYAAEARPGPPTTPSDYAIDFRADLVAY